MLNCNYFLTHQFKHCFGAQKNHIIETVLFSTHNICFGIEIKKVFFQLHSIILSPDRVFQNETHGHQFGFVSANKKNVTIFFI